MELVIIFIGVISIIIIYSIMGVNIKKLKEIALNSELNEISNKFPSNIEICKTILLDLENTNTKIEEKQESESTLYIAVSNKIIIGNLHGSFTRIQTIAHECLHSIQDKKILIFNYVYSNIYLLYFYIICILVIFNKLNNVILYSNILLIFGFIYYTVRIFLENDAMIKAQYIAYDYMKKQEYATNDEIIKIYNGFKELNKYCIKGTNCGLFIKIMIKLVIFNALGLIF